MCGGACEPIKVWMQTHSWMFPRPETEYGRIPLHLPIKASLQQHQQEQEQEQPQQQVQPQ
jgi:hypothetical protein